jgi:hypothetical protein
VGLLVAVSAACAGEPALLVPARDGMGGASTQPSLLVGTWETVLLIQVESPPDLQTWTTVWRFHADATCGFTRTVRSLVEGVDRVTERPCTWSSANFRVHVTWTDDAGGTAVLPFEFPSLDRDRLLLEGIEYRRR